MPICSASGKASTSNDLGGRHDIDRSNVIFALHSERDMIHNLGEIEESRRGINAWPGSVEGMPGCGGPWGWAGP
jgi:hypothetical protein